MTNLAFLGSPLPSKWELSTIGEVTSKIGSGATPRGGAAVYVDSDTAFIRSQNVHDHEFRDDGIVFLSEDAADQLRGVTVHEDDVLLNITGDSILRTCVVPNAVLPARVSQHVAILRSNSKVDPLFLQKWLSLPAMKEYMLGHSAGGTRKAITKGHITSFPIPVPPVFEQRAISATLGVLDQKIESNRRISALALESAEAAYLHACEYGSRTIPLRDAGRWLSGGTPSTSNLDYWGGDLPWISAASLKSFYIDRSDRTLTKAGAAVATNLVPAGTILFVVRGMSLKTEFRLGIAQRSVAFGQDCKAILPAIDSSILALALRTSRDEILDLVDEAGHGTGRLMTDLLEQFPIAIPTNPMLAQVVDPLIARGTSAARESEKLADLRAFLLPELLSGRMRVPESALAVQEAVS